MSESAENGKMLRIALMGILATAVGFVAKYYYFDPHKERLEARHQLAEKLQPKLELFRLPLASVTQASEDSSQSEYETDLELAIRQTQGAIDSLGNGYDNIRTRVALLFDSSMVYGLDSVGQDAVQVRADLARSLAEARGFKTMPLAKNPGDNLAAAERLDARITRTEKKLLTY